MISFSDTEIAFRYKSTSELKRARWLFKAISKPALVTVGNRLAHASLMLRLPIKGIIKSTLFKQFVGGETIGECEKTIQTLHRYGVGTILDYSVDSLLVSPSIWHSQRG